MMGRAAEEWLGKVRPMTRRSLCSAGFFASFVVILSLLSAACTDPNMQVNDPRSAQRSPSDYSRLAR
jgi:hypothetical protein